MKNILNAHTKNIDSVLNDAQTSFSGLSQKEAEKRLLENGKNKLMEGKKQNPFVKFLLGFCDIMIIILMIAGIVSFCVGEILDGCVIFFIVILNAVLGFVQEYKAEKALDALKKMTKPFVKVLRGDEIKKIKSEDLVVGDILVLEAGDIAMADARLIESASLKCDESSLTGESEASFKNCDAILEEKTALGDMANFVFSGSVVVYGRGLAVVVATGADTQIGKISVMLHEKKKELTPLQKSLKTVGKFITVAVLIVAAITFVLEITKGGSPDYLNAFLTSVAIAVAAIPESLPAVITIIMAMGVSRLAGKKAIVKRLHAVETLGGCEIICSDKTGTLTQNVMTVKALVYNNTMTKDIDCNKNCDEFRVLSQILALCNDSKKDVDKFVGDPTETALTNFALGYGFDKSEMDKEWIRTFEIPFDSTRKMMSTITKNSGQLFLATKGGVDEVLAKCSSILENGKVRPICEKDKSDILSKNKEMTEKALRVLCGAYKLPISEKEFTEDNLIFVGLAGMIDPPRPDVEEAVKKCQRAGMKAIMITGDHPKTALAIAKAVGIASKENEVMTGLEIDGLSDKKFVEKLSTIRVFARVSPENKVRIVEGFKSLGKIV
ncbi:MAG: HAD-IC family P-type ATPase, partial [Clostridia bacterium]